MNQFERRDVVEKTKGLAKPYHEIVNRRFYSRLRELAKNKFSMKEWDLNDAVDKAAGAFITDHIEVAAQQLGRVLDSRAFYFPREDLKELLTEVVPTLSMLRSEAMQRSNSLGFQVGPGFQIAMDDAERLTFEIELGTLEVRTPAAKEPPQRPHIAAHPTFAALRADPETTTHLQLLWDESAACYAAGAPLATVITLGSLLEAALHGKCRGESVDQFEDLNGSTISISRATLSQLIDFAEKRGWLHATRSRFSDQLRNYRNFVHPEKALKEGHAIDMGVATICWQITVESLRDLGVIE